MLICRVTGTAVATVKKEQLRNHKLLVVRQATLDNELVGDPFVAVDTVGAGSGEVVLVTRGSAAAEAGLHGRGPIDAAIVAILDSLSTDGEVVFRK